MQQLEHFRRSSGLRRCHLRYRILERRVRAGRFYQRRAALQAALFRALVKRSVPVLGDRGRGSGAQTPYQRRNRARAVRATSHPEKEIDVLRRRHVVGEGQARHRGTPASGSSIRLRTTENAAGAVPNHYDDRINQTDRARHE